jgi:hypothetical protein
MRHLHHCWPPPSSRWDECGSRSALRSTPASLAWPTWRNGTRRRRGEGARDPCVDVGDVVVQEGRRGWRRHRRRQTLYFGSGADDDVAAIDHDDVGDPPIASFLMKEVSSIVNGYQRGSGATSRPGRRNGGRTTGRGGAAEKAPSPLGKLASIVFLDNNALSWMMRRCRGAVSDSDSATTMGGGNDNGRRR